MDATELPPRTFCIFRRELSSFRRTISRRRTARNVLEELSGVSERRMTIPMTTTGRLQQRYDHRLRDLVQGMGDVTIAMDLGVPRSTARGGLGKAPKVVVGLDVTDLKEAELREEVLEVRRRVKKLTALSGSRGRPSRRADRVRDQCRPPITAT
jgi:hypothetical protein